MASPRGPFSPFFVVLFSPNSKPGALFSPKLRPVEIPCFVPSRAFGLVGAKASTSRDIGGVGIVSHRSP